jgi:RecB family endonuclease NucS
MAKNETKIWHEIKKATPKISWTRIENTSSLGTPDLLGYNSSGTFFTVELKVTKGNKVTFSPQLPQLSQMQKRGKKVQKPA